MKFIKLNEKFIGMDHLVGWPGIDGRLHCASTLGICRSHHIYWWVNPIFVCATNRKFFKRKLTTGIDNPNLGHAFVPIVSQLKYFVMISVYLMAPGKKTKGRFIATCQTLDEAREIALNDKNNGTWYQTRSENPTLNGFNFEFRR